MKKQYCLTITYRCNWACKYCISHTHEHTDDELDVDRQIEKIEPGSGVALTGGEPGLVKDEVIFPIIEKLRKKNCVIDINTNGTALKRKNLIDAVDYILYHCSENLDLDDIIDTTYDDKTEYIVVVTNDTFHKLDQFIEKNKGLNITIYPEFHKLDKSKCIEIYRKYKDRLSDFNKKVILNNNYQDLNRI